MLPWLLLNIVHEVVSQHNDEAYREDDWPGQMNEETKDDHTNANRPDHLQNDSSKMYIEWKWKCDDRYFKQNKPQSAFDEEEA